MATLTVDDNDPRIQYAGGLWEVLRGSSQQYQSTVHSTWDFNATATFSFNGVGVRVYATIPSGKGTSTVAYSLNQGSSLTVWQPSGPTTIYGKEVFYSGVLPLGAHTLVMANMGEDNDMDFELDRIVVELGGSPSTSAQAPATNTTQAPPSSSSSSSTQSASMMITTSSAPDSTARAVYLTGISLSSSSIPVASAPTSDITSSVPASTHSGSGGSSSSLSPVPKIVGSVIGAIALLVCILFILFRVRRSKGKRAWSRQIDELPTPFYPHQQNSLPNSTSELEPQLPVSSSSDTFMEADPFSRNRPSNLSLPLPPAEKYPSDLPRPSLTAAIHSVHSVNPTTTPRSFYQASIPTTHDDRPPSYHPDSR